MAAAGIDLITISREYGAGGSDLAQALGARLGWGVLDHELVQLVANRMHLELTAVERLDEHPPTRLARLASALLIAPPELPVGLETGHLLQPDAVARAVQTVIVDAAARPPLIVVGHGTQCIFAARPGTLHVRLVAPLGARVERLRARYGWDTSTAASHARRMDDDRIRYLQRYYHNDSRDPLLYDMLLNTGRISIGEAAALIATVVRDAGTATAPDAERRDRGTTEMNTQSGGRAS